MKYLLLYSTSFEGVIVNSVIQNMHYEKLHLLSKLISKFYIKFHIKVGIYKILHASSEHVYAWYPQNLSSMSKSRSCEIRIHVVFFKEKNNKNLTLATRIAWFGI